MASCTPYQAMQCRSLFDRFRNGPSMSRDGLVRVLDVIGYRAEEERYDELFAKFDSSFGETLQFDDFLEIINFLHDKVEGMRAWLNSLIALLEQMGTDTYGRTDLEESLRTECKKGKTKWNVHEMMHWIPEQKSFTIEELRQVSENVRVFAEDPPRERCVPCRTFYFSINILQAFHLELFARPKFTGWGIRYSAINPLVTARLGDVTQSTSAILDSENFEWGEELKFTLEVPSRSALEIQKWFKSLQVVFNIYDQQTGGVVFTHELIATAKVSLYSLMQRPTSSFITIVDFDTVFPTVHTNKQRCQVEVEFSMQPDCHFVNMMVPDSAYPLFTDKAKVAKDLNERYGRGRGKGGKGRRSLSRRGIDRDDDEDFVIFERYKFLTDFFLRTFPRRNIQLLSCDDLGDYRLLCEFIKPAVPPEKALPEELVVEVGNMMGRSFTSQDKPQGKIGINSIELVLFTQIGDCIEAACLLCSFFRGLGMDAFVCFGSTEGEAPCWVTSIANIGLNGVKSGGGGEGGYRDVDEDEGDEEEDDDDDDERDVEEGGESLDEGKEGGGDQREKKGNGDRVRDRKRRRRRKPKQKGYIAELLRRGGKRAKKFHQYEHLLKLCDQRRRKRIRHWFPMTGHVWPPLRRLDYSRKDDGKQKSEADSEEECPIRRVDCLVNQANIYANVQYTNRVEFVSWDLKDRSAWEPFFDSDIQHLAKTVGGERKRRAFTTALYRHLSSSRYLHENFRKFDPFAKGFSFKLKKTTDPAGLFVEDEMASKAIIQEIGGELVAYRHSQLFIPNTKFHRGISRVLQREIVKCEKALHLRSKGLVERWDFLQDIEDKISTTYLPERHMLFTRPFHFTSTISKNIVGHLVNSGVFDCSVPNARFVLAAKVYTQKRIWENTSVWVWVGYLVDVDEMIMPKLLSTAAAAETDELDEWIVYGKYHSGDRSPRKKSSSKRKLKKK